MEKIAYSDLRGDIDSFDILLFEGTGFISRAIQVLTDSPYSHVALAMRLDQWDQVLCFESTTLSSVPDLQTGAKVKGVQLVQLSDRLRSYDGNVYFRKIHGPRSPTMKRAGANVMRDFQGVPYEENQLELLSSALDKTGLLTNQPDASSVFCSEIATIMHRRVGIQRSTMDPPNESTPADYAKTLPLMPHYTTGDVVQIAA